MKESFFTHDRKFYNSLFSMLAVVALQNVLAYSVNMADNIMLGAYRQEALSGAAVVHSGKVLLIHFSLVISEILLIRSPPDLCKRMNVQLHVTWVVSVYSCVRSCLVLLLCSLC